MWKWVTSYLYEVEHSQRGGVHGTIVRRGARTTLRGGQARNRVTGGQHHVVCLRPGLATRHVGRAVYRHWGEGRG